MDLLPPLSQIMIRQTLSTKRNWHCWTRFTRSTICLLSCTSIWRSPYSLKTKKIWTNWQISSKNYRISWKSRHHSTFTRTDITRSNFWKADHRASSLGYVLYSSLNFSPKINTFSLKEMKLMESTSWWKGRRDSSCQPLRILSISTLALGIISGW